MDRKTARFLCSAVILAGILLASSCNLPSSEDAERATLMVLLFPSGTAGVGGNTPGASLTTPPPAATAPLIGPQPPFWGLATATPGTYTGSENPPIFNYYTQSGDTLPALTGRFSLQEGDLPADLEPTALLPAGINLSIPNHIGEIAYPGAILPDSEVIYSPTAVDFDTAGYINGVGGFLATYREQIEQETFSGTQIIQRIATETGISPRILLAVLEQRAGWVLGQPPDPANLDYPIGFMVPNMKGLYKEMTLTARYLTIGYYGWRAGTLASLAFTDATTVRIDPRLNAGSVAVQNLFAVLDTQAEWREELYGSTNTLGGRYQAMFGDPWQRAALVEPLLPAGLAQPPLVLPFQAGYPWALTGGPHSAWGVGAPWGGLDFAPATGDSGCHTSTRWVTASAPGLVVRSADGVVVLDLDGDGHEQTGWTLLYLHIAAQERVAVGTWLEMDENIGHPSCEGGVATGTHVHLSRKYNGEWVSATDPLPFVLSGWIAYAGSRAYQGGLVKGDQTVFARSDGSSGSVIYR